MRTYREPEQKKDPPSEHLELPPCLPSSTLLFQVFGRSISVAITNLRYILVEGNPHSVHCVQMLRSQEVRRGTVGLGRLGPEEAHLRRLLHSRARHLAGIAEGQAPLGPLIWRPPEALLTQWPLVIRCLARAPIFRKEQSGGQRRWHKALSDSALKIIVSSHHSPEIRPVRGPQGSRGERVCQKIGGHVLKLPPTKAPMILRPVTYLSCRLIKH